MEARSGRFGSRVVGQIALALGAAAGGWLSGCADDPKPQAECSMDADCGAGRACEGGRCVARAPECTSDADCGEGRRCEEGACVASMVQQTSGPPTCLSDADCPAGQGCVDGVCAAMPECELITVHFDFDDYRLRSDAQAALQATAECLRRRRDVALRVEGHCDERGTEEYNLSLGDNRARAIRDYLRDLGLDPGAIDVISYGESRPVARGQGETVWARNRRGELVRRAPGHSSR